MAIRSRRCTDDQLGATYGNRPPERVAPSHRMRSTSAQPQSLKFRQSVNQVTEGPAKTIKLPDEHSIELSLTSAAPTRDILPPPRSLSGWRAFAGHSAAVVRAAAAPLAFPEEVRSEDESHIS